MSRSGSRYPSAFGHTPSYRSYVKGSLDSAPIGYSTGYGTGGLGGSSLGSGSGLGGSSSLGRSGLGGLGGASAFDLGGSSAYDLALPSYSRDLGLGGHSGGSGNYSSSQSSQKVSKSNYSSISDSGRDGGRPLVEYSKENSLRSTATGPTGIPHSSFAHSSSAYSSEDPYKNRVSNYSYNI